MPEVGAIWAAEELKCLSRLAPQGGGRPHGLQATCSHLRGTVRRWTTAPANDHGDIINGLRDVQAKSLKPTEVRVLVKVSIALQQKVDMLGVQSRGGQGKQLNLTRLACPRLMVMNA